MTPGRRFRIFSTTTSPSATSTSPASAACCSRSKDRSAAPTSTGPCSTSCSATSTRSRASPAWSSCARPKIWRIASRTICARCGRATRFSAPTASTRCSTARRCSSRSIGARRSGGTFPDGRPSSRRGSRRCSRPPPRRQPPAPRTRRRTPPPHRRRHALALHLRAVGRTGRARHPRRHGPRTPRRAPARSSTPCRASPPTARSPSTSCSPPRSTTRRSRRRGAPTASRSSAIDDEPRRAGRRIRGRSDRGRRARRAGAAATSHFVRVDLARLDELMRNVGDLVISRARLADTLSRVEAHIPPASGAPIQENAIAIDRQLRTLREGVMRVRLVPVGEIFRRMPFVVRDLARETGKRVRLELQGQSTEIDKFLIERMMDPVLHLVRNAVSHGIETVGRAGRRRQAARGDDRPDRRDRRRHRPHRDRRRWPRHRCRGGDRAGARGWAAGAGRARRTRPRCSRCSARPDSRRATSPIAPAAAASA